MDSHVLMIEELRKALSSAMDVRSAFAAIGTLAFKQSIAESIYLYYPSDRPICIHNAEDKTESPLTITVMDSSITISGQEVSLPLFVSDITRCRLSDNVIREMQDTSVKSTCIIPVFLSGKFFAAVEFRFSSCFHRWTRDDCLLIEQMADYCGLHLGRIAISDSHLSRETSDKETLVDELVGQYQRLAHFGNLIIVRTDGNLVVTNVLGQTEDLVGLTPQQIIDDPSVWFKFVHSADLRRLLLKISRSRPSELAEEVRIINQRTGLTHWLLLRAVPRFSSKRQFMGWEGFGVDITDKHNAQEELISQGKRIEALYAVSRSLQSNGDPALVTLKGLNALVNATRSDCGVGYLFDGSNKNLEIVASVGLSKDCLKQLGEPECVNTLADHAVNGKRGILFDDIQSGPPPLVRISSREGLKSAIVIPLVFEESVLGIILLFRRGSGRYSAADFDLVSAASSQIALAAREAELFATEKVQSNSLAALYRLSHQLSQQVNMKEAVQNALPVIQEELVCKRMWLGIINDQGTHIVGQAGSGPGIRKHIIDLQIELGVRHNFLDDALRTKQPVVVNPGQKLECPDLERFFQQLDPGVVIIVPLVALGQSVGVLIVEPAVAVNFFAQNKLPLLNSMASEIAPVILARRLEARVADAQKMRAASLLASGVAHNFNNLLQAVMGQASLIEMQCEPESRAAHSARLIIEASCKGANLVKQLFSLSSADPFSPQPLSIKQLMDDSVSVYQSLLGNKVQLEVEIEPECGEVMGDYSSIQQVITNLLMNSKEAIGEVSTQGKVKISAHKVRLRSGDIDPELAPGLYLRVDIEDNGIGMNEDQIARCFEPFFTTKNVDARTGLGLTGAGLGLSSAYSIMKKHDGLITVRSQPGISTVFCLYFPAVTVRNGDVPTIDQVSAQHDDALSTQLPDTPNSLKRTTPQ